MNPVFDFVNSFAKISEETYEKLQDISIVKKIKAGTQVVKLGETPHNAFMLENGLMRCYLVTESGKEFNKSFYMSKSFFAPFTALLKQEPSLFVFEALTDCTIHEVDFCKFKQIAQDNVLVCKLYSKVLETVYVKYESRLVELISLDATSRYLELRKQISNVDELIPQYHIASYLGITPVQLSRIRKKTF